MDHTATDCRGPLVLGHVRVLFRDKLRKEIPYILVDIGRWGSGLQRYKLHWFHTLRDMDLKIITQSMNKIDIYLYCNLILFTSTVVVLACLGPITIIVNCAFWLASDVRVSKIFFDTLA